MGLFEQLENLDKTPPVAVPNAPKSVEPRTDAPIQPKPKNAPLNTATPTQHLSIPTPNLAEPHIIKKRIINRASFEVFQDQYHVLRQVSLEAKLTGDDLSISEMVREAIDDYIHRNALRP